MRIVFAPAGRLGVRQPAAAFRNYPKFLFFKFSFESASKLAHSESFASKNYPALGETPLPGVVAPQNNNRWTTSEARIHLFFSRQP
jgi:hypothetical protein